MGLLLSGLYGLGSSLGSFYLHIFAKIRRIDFCCLAQKAPVEIGDLLHECLRKGNLAYGLAILVSSLLFQRGLLQLPLQPSNASLESLHELNMFVEIDLSVLLNILKLLL